MHTSKFITLKPLFMLLVLIACNSLFGQTVKNGRLVFASKASFEQTYNRLTAESDANIEPTTEPKEGIFYDPNPVLAKFESGFSGFKSLRLIALQDEFNQLQAGRTPEALVDRSWVPDEVAESMLNGDYVVQVADTIFYLLDKNITVKILNADERVLAGILKGDPLALYNDKIKVESRGGDLTDGECLADFTASSSFLNSNSGQFTFTGSGVQANTTYSWDFGDGTYSSQKNPIKTYSTPGEYDVCLTIQTNDATMPCLNRVCRKVKVNQNCQAYFKYSKGGTPGLICFVDQSMASNATITSRTWDFGDGATSTETNPCHTYLCDKTYWVKLTITASNGCKSETVIGVKVTSYACCDKDIDENETAFTIETDPGKRKIRGNCEDFYVLWGLWSNVNAELRQYRRGLFTWVQSNKSLLKVEIIGNVYTKDENDCICKTTYPVDCSDAGHVHKVKAKKHIGAKFKTYKNDPWIANFYEDGVLRKTIVAPVTCD